MAIKNTDTKVVTGKVRFSYLHVFEPYAMEEGQEKKYSVCLLIPKSDKDTLNRINAAIKAATQAGLSLWGGKIPPNLKLPLRDGDVDREGQDEYKNHYFINASSKTKPGIVDAAINPILDSTEIYSGCYGRASVNFYPFNKAGSKGVACGLNNLQKLADGDYLGGRSKPEDDFEVEDTTNEDILG